MTYISLIFSTRKLSRKMLHDPYIVTIALIHTQTDKNRQGKKSLTCLKMSYYRRTLTKIATLLGRDCSTLTAGLYGKVAVCNPTLSSDKSRPWQVDEIYPRRRSKTLIVKPKQSGTYTSHQGMIYIPSYTPLTLL